MRRLNLIYRILLLSYWPLISNIGYAQNIASFPLLDFENGYGSSRLDLTDAQTEIVGDDRYHALRVIFGNRDIRPSVDVIFPETDLSGYLGIAMDIRNEGDEAIAVEAQCFNGKTPSVTINDGARFFYRSMVVLKPGESDSLFITFSRSPSTLPAYVNNYFKGMFGLPGGYVRRKENIDLTRINTVSIFKLRDGKHSTFSIDNIRAVGRYSLSDESALQHGFFPFVDRFGQYRHRDWPGKTRSTDDIVNQRLREQAALETYSGPVDWNQYGGWATGPALTATGHFRVEKYHGKWWLVDPLGKLFWSQGLNIVGISQRTPIQGREHYFTSVPLGGDFYKANLMTKYEGNLDKALETVHKRLRSWGMNTIAANSNPDLYVHKKTPYTIEIRSGISNPIPDNIDEAEFRALFVSRLQRDDIVAAANDPWCIGYFVDNELAWPSENSEKTIGRYFRIIHEELRKFAPHKLYLGCRSNSPNFNRIAFETAARYCDVISINHYDYNLSDFRETDGLDRPVIVGEFHFGALDRGLLHPGLRAVANQKQRARVYQHFVNQALNSPIIVGTHWFQYVDQICTGRNDGENYQIGFVDVCDRPYPEITATASEIGSYLYTYRLNGTGAADR
ncbi:hypothetical protein [Olivibacter jilunii]|uniref:hypothetical protein n=1 Tax=Olivibacter jilunii TaxID=985016 RepID=UPI003F16432D